MPGWWDDDDDFERDPVLRLIWPRVEFDPDARQWVCDCRWYKRKGRCPHIITYRPTVQVEVLERYLLLSFVSRMLIHLLI